MSDSADPVPSQPPPGPSPAAARPDPDMPPRKSLAGGKLRKPLTDKQRAAAEQRLERLRARLLLRPLDGPSPRALPPAHEAALRALGLLEFVRLDLASDAPRPDLVAPLVAFYDPTSKRSFVRGVRVAVSRSDLARALYLPSKAASAASASPPDIDPAVLVPAVMQLLQDYILRPFQGDDMCILPQEVAAAEQAVREGSAHRVDWAGLIWGLIEKEMLELPNRDNCVCYYGLHLQRLIMSQKPNLFELVEEGDRGEIDPEASVDVEMEEEDGEADVKSKSLEEPELRNDDAGADTRSQGLEEPELGNADARDNGLNEIELGNADTRDKIWEESESGDVDVRSRDMEKLEGVNEDLEIKGLGESEAIDEDGRRNSLNESEVGEEYTKDMTLDELDKEDHEKGGNLDELNLGSVGDQAMPDLHDVVPADNDDTAEVAPERGDDVAVPAQEVAEGSLVETVVRTQIEIAAVPEEVLDEDAEGEEDKDAMGLSLGISSINGYDSVDLEEEANAENLDEDDSDNEEAEESEDDDDDAFEECRDEDDMNWRIGDGKDDGEMTHCLQRGNSSSFGNMQFENLNKGDVEMRDELRFDDFPGREPLERMTSSNLLQAMNSIPASYNVADNVHDLSSGDFLAMGGDAHKNGLDLGPGSSYLFGNNGKRHIGDIDGYNTNMQVQEQFPQCNQQKRMRHSNSSSVSAGPSDFNSNIMVPIQNLMVEASKLYEQKDQEVQSLQMEKRYFTDMLQEKDALIQSLNSARFEQQNRWQAQLRRFEHDLNVMAQLVTGYKKALKQNQASFDEYKKKFPCNKPRYDDVPDGGGLVLTVKELERRQLEVERQKLAAANDMIRKFEQEWFSKLDESMSSVHSLNSRLEELYKEIRLIKETRKARFEAPPSEECAP
ncbi:hypothetical protein QOZ80_6AG0542120 [Eleusine coracana subsp. coracana]|nr:hypothetical protein QOZ80_6AG0542120 [Eleusine coracana subsp. coracana]